MGYCYQGNRLCCDVCGEAGARKYACPHGYCQAYAMCPKCHKDPKVMTAFKEMHVRNKCKELSAKFHAREAEKARMLAEGKAVRCSACSEEGHGIHVIFQRADGSTVGYYMSAETYHAIDYETHTTPEDYMNFGAVIPAEPTYANGAVSKDVASIQIVPELVTEDSIFDLAIAEK